MKYELKVEFTKDEINSLAEHINNALEKEITDEQALEYWEKLPDEIKLDAMKWGITDTEVGDDIYTWAKKTLL